MTAVDALACGPGGGYPTPTWAGQPGPRDPTLALDPVDVTRVLVVGQDDPHTVRWALTQMWRRAGRPIVVAYNPGTTVGRQARWWATEHGPAGVRGEPADGQPADIVLSFGRSWAAALARQAGVHVVDGRTVGELQ